VERCSGYGIDVTDSRLVDIVVHGENALGVTLASRTKEMTTMTLTLLIVLGVAIWIAVRFSKHHTDKAIGQLATHIAAEQPAQPPIPPTPKVPQPVQAIRTALENACKVESSDAEIMKNAVEWCFNRHSEAEQERSREKFLAFLKASKAELEALGGPDTVVKPSVIFRKYDAFLETVPIGSFGYQACRDAALSLLNTNTLGVPSETAQQIKQAWKDQDQQRFLSGYAEMKRTAIQAVRIEVREKIEAAKAMGLDVSLEEAALKQLEA
jgi:hypothetical protein